RCGQGVFKSKVRLNEAKCRVTGITDVRFLIASHIKPWRLCNDQEKLDGANGLLLSPHVDRLFDRGFISFEDDGTLICSPSLPREVADKWLPKFAINIGRFNPKQAAYLAFHRKSIFKS
ncbi:MAG: HNH endonuclease, partial [Betaproteobacteria bacterium]